MKYTNFKYFGNAPFLATVDKTLLFGLIKINRMIIKDIHTDKWVFFGTRNILEGAEILEQAHIELNKMKEYIK